MGGGQEVGGEGATSPMRSPTSCHDSLVSFVSGAPRLSRPLSPPVSPPPHGCENLRGGGRASLKPIRGVGEGVMEAAGGGVGEHQKSERVGSGYRESSRFASPQYVHKHRHPPPHAAPAPLFSVVRALYTSASEERRNGGWSGCGGWGRVGDVSVGNSEARANGTPNRPPLFPPHINMTHGAVTPLSTGRLVFYFLLLFPPLLNSTLASSERTGKHDNGGMRD